MSNRAWFVLLALSGACRASGPPPWQDPAAHTIRMIAVAHDTVLEVLDWGGTGRPLVLLPGGGNTAHVFDNFAPGLTDSFHVYGVTPRGFGRSSALPDSDLTTSVNDLRIVLDSLRLPSVILVGHAIAGEEMTHFAVSYPDRCQALVYLDAAYDRSGTKLSRELAQMPIVGRPAITARDSASVDAFEAYYTRTGGVRLPEAELRATMRFNAAGRYVTNNLSAPPVVRRIFFLLRHLPPPPYQSLKCPSLAIYPVPDSPSTSLPWYGLADSSGRAMIAQRFPLDRAVRSAAISQYRDEALSAHVLELHNANHYVFLSNRDEVLSAIRQFLATLSGGKGARAGSS